MILLMNPTEIEECQKGRRVYTNETITLRDNSKFVNVYFVGCTFTGSSMGSYFTSTFFQQCTFDATFVQCLFSVAPVVNAMVVTRLSLTHCKMMKTNFPSEYRHECQFAVPDIAYFSDLPPYIFLGRAI